MTKKRSVRVYSDAEHPNRAALEAAMAKVFGTAVRQRLKPHQRAMLEVLEKNGKLTFPAFGPVRRRKTTG